MSEPLHETERPGAPRREDAERRKSRARGIALRLLGIGVVMFALGYLLATLLFFRGGAAHVVTVPDLRGETEAEAARVLDRLDLAMERGSALVHPEVPAGSVLAQSPLPGQEVPPGSVVRVTLSAGRDRITVPDVSRFGAAQAQELLTRSGFEVRIDSVPNERARGRVIATEPAAGTPVELPAQLRLIVSAGPPLTAVPDLAGLDEEAARQALEAAGLRTGEIGYDPYAYAAPGSVIAQEPAPGDSIAVGSAVRLTVAGFSPRPGVYPYGREPGAPNPEQEQHPQQEERIP
ncbi:MAG TPA: PASTA domain-containing protein [Longimicrobiaceae bacterium]|nr:PASTA domain-containing protein [Longimicrobiaceae bacterium]